MSDPTMAERLIRNRAGDLDAIPVTPEDNSTWLQRAAAFLAGGGPWGTAQPGQRGAWVPTERETPREFPNNDRPWTVRRTTPSSSPGALDYLFRKVDLPGVIPIDQAQAIASAPLSDIVRSGDRDAMRAAAEASFDVASMLPAAGVAAGRMRKRPDTAGELFYGRDGRQYQIEAVNGQYNVLHRGERIGSFEVSSPIDGDTVMVSSANVSPEHRRNRVASAVYDAISRDATNQGRKLVPSDNGHSGDGAAFWRSRSGVDLPATSGREFIRELNTKYANPDDPTTASILAALSAQEKPKGIKAYHGSPHDFDKFDLSKIGTGEGAQAYGHGLYFAENEGVARSYRDPHSSNVFKYDGVPAGHNWQTAPLEYLDQKIATTRGVDVALADAIQRLKKQAEFHRTTYENGDPAPNLYDGAVARLEKLDPSKIQPPGRMYEVRINADPADFLDWDKPLSQQSEKVRQTLGDDLINALGGDVPGAALTDLMRQSSGATDDAISAALKGKGIPGIKYLDQGSRSAGEESRNYVVFDDALVDILRKYSNPDDPTTAAILALLTVQQGGQQQQ